MPVERIGKFLRFDDLGITPSLGVETDKIDVCIAEVKKSGVKGLFGCPVFGFKQDNLDFLKETPDVEQLWFWEINLKNIDGIYSLKNLRYFGIQDKRAPIDFSMFSELEHMVWNYTKKDKGLTELLKVKNFDLWRYNPKTKSYDGLCLPPNIEKLDVNWANPSTLEGLQCLPRLREIQFHYCRNLTTLKGLEVIAPNLEKLVVTRCKNMTDIDVLNELKNIKYAYINNERIIS